ncbi:MAG: AMP-binding protein [Hyphomicrobiales bacterium]|nr:AMP-binding protein [Hyphomicrobiales bacterium]
MFEGMNLAAMLAGHARRRPSHPAIIDRGLVLTFGELDPLVRRTAAHLRALGAGPGDVVGVWLDDRAGHLVALQAVPFLGAVLLPLDPRWTAEEAGRVAAFFAARLVLAEPGRNLDGIACVAVDDAWDAAVAAATPLDRAAPGGDAPVVLSLSSGTTGRPKGPMLSHAQFISRFVIQWATLGFCQQDRYLSATPLYFGAGRGFVMGYLFAGATVILFPPPYEPADLVRAVQAHGATTLLLVPTLLRRLLAMAGGGGRLLGGLRVLLSTGATLHAEERHAVMDRLAANFINYYGSTEGGGVSVLLPGHGAEADGSVGQPVFATDVQVVGGDERPLPAGETGRIRYRGPAVAGAFHNDPEASAAAFRDGWYYPGDLGRLDGDGFLYLTGRAKDVIIRGGVNVYPDEVEQILLAHPAVRDAAVVAWPSPDLGEEVAAFVVAPGATAADLAAHCRAHLAPYKVPREIFAVDDLPRTTMDKVAKDQLARRLPPLTPTTKPKTAEGSRG